MITTGEVIKDLNSIIKKVEFLQVTYPRNELWPTVYEELKKIKTLIEKDLKIFGYE